MKINNAHDLQEFINSIRKKAFEEVVNLINSDDVRKDPNGFITMYDDDLIRLVQTIDAARAKQKANADS